MKQLAGILESKRGLGQDWKREEREGIARKIESSLSSPLSCPQAESKQGNYPPSYTLFSDNAISFFCCNASIRSGISVALDGEIYNESKLYQLLEGTPYQGKKESIESLISSLYEALGPEFAVHLNGCFALALYDTKAKELLLFRDRVGQKPLYWTQQSHAFLFASELKGIVGSGQLLTGLHPESIACYLSFGFLPQEKTLLRKVYKLLPAHYLRLTQDGHFSIQPYWSYSTELEKRSASFDLDQLHFLVKQAFDLRFSSHSTTTSPMACFFREEREGMELLPFFSDKKELYPLAIYSPLFRKNPISQAPFPVSFHGYVEDPEAIVKNLPALVYQMDEPNADLIAPFLWEMGKSAQQLGFQRGLVSTGSLDWLIAHIQKPQVRLDQLLFSLDHAIQKSVSLPLISLIYPKGVFSILRSLHTHPWHQAFMKQYQIFDKAEFRSLHSESLRYYDSESLIHQFPALQKLGAEWSSLLYMSLKIGLPDRYCVLEDRLLARQGVTPITPFLDVGILEYLGSVANRIFPSSIERTFRQVFLSSIFSKKSFSQTDFRPFVSHRALLPLYQELGRGFLAQSGIISTSWVTKALSRIHHSPKIARQAWSLLVLETWIQLFVEPGSGAIEDHTHLSSRLHIKR